MKIFIFIIFIMIIFAIGNLYNWVVRKFWDLMEEVGIVPITLITILLATIICFGLCDALER